MMIFFLEIQEHILGEEKRKIKLMLKRKDGSANCGAAVYAYGKITDFWASIKIVTNLQKIFKKVVQTADFLIYYLR